MNTHANWIQSGCDGKDHPPFTGRPYRRGRRRCHTCGGFLRISFTHWQWIEEMYDGLDKSMRLWDQLFGVERRARPIKVRRSIA